MTIRREGANILICDCEGTMPLDAERLAKALGADAGGKPFLARQLCRAQMDVFEKTAREGAPLITACTQEAPVFLEALEEIGGAPEAFFVNIREKAGWSEDHGAQGRATLPKMAALIAEAQLELEPAKSAEMVCEGALLILGNSETAADAAERLADRLNVTLVLEGAPGAVPPRVTRVPVFTGRVTGAEGRLGAFQVRFENFAPLRPSSRGAMSFEGPGRSGVSQCDLILDLRGGAPLFSGPEIRDGYENPDPKDPARVERALFDLSGMTGSFEKPRYIDFDAGLCAHARSKITGCRRCLDVCPAGAVEPKGDAVFIDPHICGGCGMCAGVCPTGAAQYALPGGTGLHDRMRAVLSTYRSAGGENPVLLFHDTGHGEAAIDLMARFSGGLPANVIPSAVNSATQLGLDAFVSALAYGAARIIVLVPPAHPGGRGGLDDAAALAETVMSALGWAGDRVHIIDEADPDAVAGRLRELAQNTPAPAPASDFKAMGRKRAVLRLGLGHLHSAAPEPADVAALPEGAPFGRVLADAAGCTLCLACVGACPTGALRDSPEKPSLSFVEDACVQCGLCKNTCPEGVITLEPRLSFLESARTAVTLKEEDPAECVRCGRPFGVKSAVERTAARLQGHAMFETGAKLDMIRMCEDCRVKAQFEDDHPLSGPARPRIRTTDDDLREREELRAKARADMAAKGLSPPGGDETKH